MDAFFSAPTGKVANPAEDGLSNSFADITARSVDDLAQSNRVQPGQITTGVLRGTQRIQNTDGSYITLGVIPNTNGEFGIAFFTATDDLIAKDTGPTKFVYDPTTNKNVMQIGKLPDGSYGWHVAATGYDVEDAFS